MTTKQDEAARLLDLPAADYFTFGEEHQLKLQHALAKLSDGAERPGQTSAPLLILALGAPKSVNVDKQTNVPVLVGSMQSGLRAWQVNFSTNLHLFLRSLSTGELWVAEPLVNLRRGKQELLSGKGTPPDELDAGTIHSAVALVDLREKMADGIKPGAFSVTAIANELRSNSLSVRMESSAPPAKPRSSLPQPYMQHKLESRAQFDTRVEIPRTASGKEPILVRVAMQVSENAGVLQPASQQPIWPCHVILVKLDERPQIIPAVVPVQRVAAPGGGSLFNAVFQVEVRAAAKSPLIGSYQLYLDVGREFLGPYPLTITN